MRSAGTRIYWTGAVCAWTLLLIGCSEPASVVAPPQTPDAAASGEQASDSEDIVPTASESNGKSTADSSAAGTKPAAAAGDYKPPFPDRVDMFVAPKRQGGPAAMGEGQDAVQLLGFVRLDRTEVVLSVNGQVVPLAEGATEYGIEVVSIQPPMVVLQRGRQRWQASLEN
jgi:sulfur carrier protein ThiS